MCVHHVIALCICMLAFTTIFLSVPVTLAMSLTHMHWHVNILKREIVVIYVWVFLSAELGFCTNRLRKFVFIYVWAFVCLYSNISKVTPIDVYMCKCVCIYTYKSPTSQTIEHLSSWPKAWVGHWVCLRTKVFYRSYWKWQLQWRVHTAVG